MSAISSVQPLRTPYASTVSPTPISISILRASVLGSSTLALPSGVRRIVMSARTPWSPVDVVHQAQRPVPTSRRLTGFPTPESRDALQRPAARIP
jgi:hypothetical protein